MRLSKEQADKLARRFRAALNKSARDGKFELHLHGVEGAWIAFRVQVFDSLDKNDPQQRWIFP